MTPRDSTMAIADFDDRLRRLTETLSHLLEGEYDAIEPYGEIPDDPFGRIEETVEFLVLDVKTVALANRDKEASLLMQQDQLAAKTEELEAQRQRIRQQELDLEIKAETIARQAEAIRELSTPILEVWDNVIVMPIIGVIDTRRSVEIMTSLLDNVARARTKWVIIDITGVEVVDTGTGEYLIKVCRAASLLGVSCLLCGIRPAVAQTLVEIGVELSEVSTKRSLKEALHHCLVSMQRK